MKKIEKIKKYPEWRSISLPKIAQKLIFWWFRIKGIKKGVNH
jgi:hypothetical protein